MNEEATHGGSPDSGPKVIVGSGWWCGQHDWALGSSRTREVDFFALWHQQVLKCLNPHRIVVTDSASPVKPDWARFERVQWIELDRNYGHPNDLRVGKIRTKYSGFTRGVLSGAMYALCCDADIYAYVEQDCVLHGDDFLAQALAGSREDILLGRPTENGKGIEGRVAAPMLQQSLMLVRRAGLERFISGLLASDRTDGERSPEETMRLLLPPFDLIAVPYGRSRPIDFTQRNFYAQHLDEDELRQMLAVTGKPAGMAPV